MVRGEVPAGDELARDVVPDTPDSACRETRDTFDADNDDDDDDTSVLELKHSVLVDVIIRLFPLPVDSSQLTLVDGLVEHPDHPGVLGAAL